MKPESQPLPDNRLKQYLAATAEAKRAKANTKAVTAKRKRLKRSLT